MKVTIRNVTVETAVDVHGAPVFTFAKLPFGAILSREDAVQLAKALLTSVKS